MTFQFWRRWLMGVTTAVIVYGFIMVLFPAPMQTVFRTLFFSEAERQVVFSTEAMQYSVLVQGVLGAVLVGWMLTLLLFVRHYFHPDQPQAWTILAVVVVTWFIIDSGFSLVIGVPAHALFNVGFFIALALPLAGTYRAFKTSSVAL